MLNKGTSSDGADARGAKAYAGCLQSSFVGAGMYMQSSEDCFFLETSASVILRRCYNTRSTLSNEPALASFPFGIQFDAFLLSLLLRMPLEPLFG